MEDPWIFPKNRDSMKLTAVPKFHPVFFLTSQENGGFAMFLQHKNRGIYYEELGFATNSYRYISPLNHS